MQALIYKSILKCWVRLKVTF